MKSLLLLTVLFVAGLSYGQSKKEQIEILTNRVDSLNNVVQLERENSSKEITELNAIVDGLNTEISELKKSLSELKSSVANLEKDKSKLTRENEKFKTDLEEMAKKNLELERRNSNSVANWSEKKIDNNSESNIQLTLMDEKGVIATFYNWNENYTDGLGNVEISQKIEWISADTYFEYTYHKINDGESYLIEYNLYGWDYEKDEKIIFPQWTRIYEYNNGSWKEINCTGDCG